MKHEHYYHHHHQNDTLLLYRDPSGLFGGTFKGPAWNRKIEPVKEPIRSPFSKSVHIFIYLTLFSCTLLTKSLIAAIY